MAAEVGIGAGQTRLRRLTDRLKTYAGRSPSRFAILAFTSIIFIVTLVLSTPMASANGTWTPLHESLFTATSTVCVTGLAVVDMATHWSPFGNAVILIGAQIGGIGVLTMASMLGMVVTRRLSLRQRLIAASDTNPLRTHAGPVSEGQAIRLGEVGGLLTTVLFTSLIVEFVLFIGILPNLLIGGASFGTAVYDSVYLSVSAFNNVGYTPFPEGLAAHESNSWLMGMLVFGVFAGSLGYPVVYTIMRNLRAVLKRSTRHPHWSLHVRLTLVATAAMALLGTLAFSLSEWNNPETFGDNVAWSRPFEALFYTTMTRSGGFALFDPAELNDSSLLMSQLFIFIGGGSASTAGGIKVTTVAVLLLAALAEARGQGEIQAFDRRIPNDVLRVAVSIVLWGTTIVLASTIAILPFTDRPLADVLFDVISAFATCGLSTGVTQELPTPAIVVLSATMWAGRVGTVTLAAAIASSSRRQLYKHPEERPIVG